MDKKIWLAAALACVAGAASAQENIIRPVQGAKEVGISGNWTSVGGTSSYTLTGSVGYYFTNNLVGQTAVALFKASGSSTATLWFLGGRYEFNTTGQMVPYVLAGLFLENNGGGSNSSTFKAGAGVNYFTRPNSAFFAELSFFRFSGDGETTTTLDFGLRMFFK
jgi:hypothetical protein